MTFDQYAAIADLADRMQIIEDPSVPPNTVLIGTFGVGSSYAEAFEWEQVEPLRIDLVAGEGDVEGNRVTFRATETLRLRLVRPDLLPPVVVKLAEDDQ